MRADGSVPSDGQSSDELPRIVEARSVYSPAAYLADLLQLMDDRFERAALLEAGGGSRTSRSTPRTPSPRSRTWTS